MDTERKQLYMKDKGGDTILTSVVSYKDKVIRCVPVFKHLQRTLSDLQHFKPKPDDVWILAYPKSGTHWLCEIIGILTSGQLQPVKEHKESMMVEAAESLADIENLSSPRVINTHIQMNYLPSSILERSKIICAVRNPKSACVSFFHHMKKQPQFFEYSGTFENYLPLMCEEGLDDVSGSWYNYQQTAWTSLRGKSNVHFVFYEELLKDPLTGIKRIAEFLGLERDDKYLQQVAELTSFSNMSQSKGKDMTSKWHKITCDPEGKSMMFRSGKIDDWKKHLTVRQNEEFDKEYDERMKDYPELKDRIKFE